MDSKSLNIDSFSRGVNKPPAAVEIEETVLGAMLIEPEAVPKALEILSGECFYEKKHRILFEAMEIGRASRRERV